MPVPQLVAGIAIKVAGQALDPSVAGKVIEARVQDNLMLPDAFGLRLDDPDFSLVDGALFAIGAKIELHFAPAEERGTSEGVFKGEIATIAPEFEHEGVVLVVRGYDVSQRLRRGRYTRTFQDMTASDIASKIVRDVGLTVQAEPTGDVYPFEQQSNETDWDFLWRLAGRIGFEVACVEEKIHFRAPGSDPAPPVKLAWGQGLRAFRPRATAMRQIEKVTVSGWDPKAKRRVSADAQTARMDSRIGLERDRAAKDLGGGTLSVTEKIVTSQGEADGLAQSTLDRVANAWLEAEGRAMGNPAIRAGKTVQITGVGTRFGGDYLITKSTHVIRGGVGYETQFEISGRSRRTLIDLLTPATRHPYAGSLVIGIVTNNDDPEKMGRVRVKFPGLDDRQEGWWARVASPSASGKRGLMMMPLIDDEVVVGFEHDDPRRPFVLGSLWNGTGKPEALAAEGGGKPDGSFNLRSDKKIAISSGSDLSIASEAKLDAKAASDCTLSTDGKLAVTAKGSEITITCGGGSVTVNQDGTITIKGTQITVDATAKLALTSSGVVQVRGSQIMLG